MSVYEIQFGFRTDRSKAEAARRWHRCRRRDGRARCPSCTSLRVDWREEVRHAGDETVAKQAACIV